MKKIQIIFISCILLICMIPVLSRPVFQSDITNSKSKGIRSEFPELEISKEGITTFFSDFSSYLDDNFNFRDNLIGVNSYFMEHVFHTSAQKDVIVGKEDWLYYGATLDDYMGENRLDDVEIKRIIQTLTLIEEYVEESGAEFAFTIAPNKNSIYPENMPAIYLKGDGTTNAEQLAGQLSDSIYVDLYSELRAQKEVTYLKRDSHWNNYGAYIGFQKILEGLNIQQVSFDIIDACTKKEFDADLEGMLYPLYGSEDEQIYYQYDSDFRYASKFKTVEDITIKTTSETGVGSIVVFRDSFGNALLDNFARQFNQVEFSRAVPYSIYKAKDVDYMVIELVERNIPNLLKTAPIMPAPERKVNNLKGVDNPYVTTKDVADYTHIYGYIEVENPEDIEQIYIQVDGMDVCYEAFTILEADLEKDEENNSEMKLDYDAKKVVGYSAYIPKEEIDKEKINKEEMKVMVIN